MVKFSRTRDSGNYDIEMNNLYYNLNLKNFNYKYFCIRIAIAIQLEGELSIKIKSLLKDNRAAQLEDQL